MVVVTGTNFRLPNAPPVSGPAPTPPPSVVVSFGSRVAPRVLVLSSTELRVFLPAGVPGAPVALAVQNLGPTGLPIAGELAVRPAAFTFLRPDLASTEWTLQRVVRAVIRLCKEQYLENTVHTTHTDFDDDVTDGLNIVAVSKLPAVVIAGPEVRENRFFSRNDAREEVQQDGTVRKLPVAWTADAVFTFAVFSSSEMEMLALLEAFAIFSNAVTMLTVDRVGSDPSKGSVEYEFDFSSGGDPKVMNTPNNSNVRCFTAMLEVRGIDLDPVEDLAVDQTRPLAELPDPVDPSGAPPVPDVTIDGGSAVGGYIQFNPVV